MAHVHCMYIFWYKIFKLPYIYVLIFPKCPCLKKERKKENHEKWGVCQSLPWAVGVARHPHSGQMGVATTTPFFFLLLLSFFFLIIIIIIILKKKHLSLFNTFC